MRIPVTLPMNQADGRGFQYILCTGTFPLSTSVILGKTWEEGGSEVRSAKQLVNPILRHIFADHGRDCSGNHWMRPKG